MIIKTTHKYLLSLLLCLPFCTNVMAKSVSSDTASTAKVQTAKVKQTKTAATARTGYPKRGMTMKQVRRHYGKPHSIRKSAGKVKKNWPRITVWNYGKFSVYFERHITLHTVVH